ncbi:MAG: OsmC family protein [Bacteroidota bacterium]
MKTATVHYEGQLRTQAIHVKSDNALLTDAPIDNHGKGETFSPTDLVATATVSCMITVMGIHAEKNQLDMGTVDGSVEKIMASGPRRIAALNIELVFQGHNLNESAKKRLEHIAIHCPVANSLSNEMIVNVKFRYD